MATFLSLVNDLLVELREDEVTTWNETAYSKLIGKFINRAKSKVEKAHYWTANYTTYIVTTTAGTYAYALTGAGNESVLLQKDGGRGPDVFNNTEDLYLKQPPFDKMSYWLNLNDPDNGIPHYFGFNDFDASGDPIVDLYPIPDGVYSILFNMYVPTAELTADADTVIIPVEAIRRYAYYLAIKERGDDGSGGIATLISDYTDALADDIVIDRLRLPNHNSWDAE
jgi:hypothetical protein